MGLRMDQVRSSVFGRALQTMEAPHQTIGKAIGLAVFCSDSLSSVAYAGDEILLVLASIGAAYYWLLVPITVAIALLLIILALSYRQTIYAYPSGGGAYIVARDNLGEAAAQVAGAALVTDYVLTVAVSIASGVDQVASAIPLLFQYKLQIALLLILFMALINLRGVKESGTAFALPAYFFLAMMFITLGAGFFKALTGTLGTVGTVQGAVVPNTAPVSGLVFGFLVLRAFSSGTTALTGVEAVSNGITVFKEPKSKNAATTLMWDATLLMVLFVGLSVLGYLVGAQRSEQEVLIAQVTRVVYGTGFLRLLTLASATLVLILAANTSYADFPRLTALIAGDGFLPRFMTVRSSRLVFSFGIVILTALACGLVIVFGGNVSRLIPLYAIGVFLSFTLSQTGMVLRWQKVGRLMRRGELPPGKEITTLGSVLTYDRAWRPKQLLNAVGAVITLIVTIVFLVSKFTQGAWITAILIPSLIALFFRIHHHYRHVAYVLSTANTKIRPKPYAMRVIVLVADVQRETFRLVEFARSLGRPWVAVHVAVQEDKVPRIQQKWQERVGEGQLIILPSPYRGISGPIRDYVIDQLQKYPDDFVQVVMGELVTDNPATQILHQNADFIERLALRDLDRVVLTTVPLQLRVLDREQRAEAMGGQAGT